MMNISTEQFKNAFEVFSLFLIPIGGGIPAGVILGESRSVSWPMMMFLYFCSDVVLACVFEPIMLFVIKATHKSAPLKKFFAHYKESLSKTGIKFGLTTSPFALIVIAFGVDPMTGRVAAKTAGHGFFSGWAIAICGDMFFFTLIMVSTLWLNSILGDGTTTAIIILALMIGIPMLIDRWKARRYQFPF